MKPPKHPVGRQTTYELRDYRRDLEHAVTRVPERSADRELLQSRLAEVITEQEARREAEIASLAGSEQDNG